MAEYLVNSIEHVTSKNGKKYMRMKLFADSGRQWPAMGWADDENLKAGMVIDALTKESEYNGEAQLEVTAHRVIQKSADAFYPKTKYSIDGMMKELGDFVDSVENDKIHKLLEKAVVDERWRRAPAAVKMHHAFIGGLLEHVLELCRLSNAVQKLYPVLNRDLLIAASILHDIGKMEEMNCGQTIEYTTSGELLGHILQGILRIDRWMEDLEFDVSTRMHIKHIIASHHGNMAFGAIKEPATLEAQIFSNLDGISANMGKITAAIERAKPDSEWSDKTDYKQRIWIGGRADA